MLDPSTQMRLTGLATGIDTDAIIKSLGKAHAVKIDAVKRDKQLLLWRQEAYRSTINMVSGFLKSSFNSLNAAGNFRSPSAFAKFSYNLSLGGSVTDAAKAKVASIVSVTANGDLKKFNQTIESVAQLATKDTWTGKSMGLNGIVSNGFDIEKFGRQTGNGWASDGAMFTVSIDGVSRTISLDGQDIQQIYANKGMYSPADNNDMYKPADLSSFSGVDDSNFDLSKYYVDAGGGHRVNAWSYFNAYFAAGGADVDISDSAIASYFSLDSNGEISFNATDTEVDDLIAGLNFNSPEAGALVGNFLKGISTENGAGPIQLEEKAIDLDNNYLYFKNIETGVTKYASVGDYLKNNAGLTDSQITAIKDNGGLNPDMTAVEFRSLILDLTGETIDNITDSDLGQVLQNVSAAPLFVKNTGSDPNSAAHDIAQLINQQIVTQFGNDYAGLVSDRDGELVFNRPGSTVVINDMVGWQSTLPAMGLSGGASSSNFNNRTVGDIFDASFFESGNEQTIYINEKSITISKTDTINSLMSKINNASAGVTMSYNSAADKFVLTSNVEGSASNIQMAGRNTYEFLAQLGMATKTTSNGNTTYDFNGRVEGQNLIAMINGEKYVKQTNSFTFEGMTFSFTETFNKQRFVDGEFLSDEEVDDADLTLDPAIKIQVNKNTSEVVDSIKSFVDEYNKIIDHINGLLSEKRDRDYKPLTDEEKAAMSEKEIEAYEAKAKQGIMANDSDLRKLLDQMRSAIYQKVEGVGLSMADIGITTTSNWKDGGRLAIDENKLSSAIENRYDEVVSLFTKADVGVSQRLNTVFNAAVGTTGDKGYLVNKAGTINDATQYKNTIQTKINEYDKRLDALLERWYRQEDRYYQMFARMESAMMKMQSQQNSLASLMAQSGGK